MSDLRERLSYDALKLAVRALAKPDGYVQVEKAEALANRVLDVLCGPHNKLPPHVPADDSFDRKAFDAEIDRQLAANARTSNEPLSGTETARYIVDSHGDTLMPKAIGEGARVRDGGGNDWVVRDGKWNKIPEAKVIGRNGDADLAARLGMTKELRNPLDFDDYKPAGDEP